MHLNKYYFINKFNYDHIKKLDKNVSIIYRNYHSLNDINLIVKIRDFCKKNSRKFFLANNVKLALKLNLDGAYLPSFNSDLKHLAYFYKKKFLIIGSAHSIKQIRIKEKQKVEKIFISSIFKNNKNFLGFYKFKILSSVTKKQIVALGGINLTNVKKLKMLNLTGFAGIGYFDKVKKKAP
jgi:thiamine-phosphate pyrophosphorylase